MALHNNLSALTIVYVLGFSMAHICMAMVSPIDKEEFLLPHNIARARRHEPPIEWNETVAEYAEAYAHERSVDCALQHSDYLNPGYGENIAVSFGDLRPDQAVDLWVEEKPFYDYKSNSCVEGQMCGHYTQVVWKGSKSIGCASAKCENGGTFITCNYYPPGNYIGERPY